ncbi:MAG: hypothetical protein ACRDHZ_19415 [Ktedonobacteraceae bacterium]
MTEVNSVLEDTPALANNLFDAISLTDIIGDHDALAAGGLFRGMDRSLAGQRAAPVHHHWFGSMQQRNLLTIMADC